MAASFPLAPMDGLVRGLTVVMLLLPVVLLGVALVQHPAALVTGGPTFQLYISRVDRSVVVHTKPGTRPLLLTPAEPERFVEEVRVRVGREGEEVA